VTLYIIIICFVNTCRKKYSDSYRLNSRFVNTFFSFLFYCLNGIAKYELNLVCLLGKISMSKQIVCDQ